MSAYNFPPPQLSQQIQPTKIVSQQATYNQPIFPQRTLNSNIAPMPMSMPINNIPQSNPNQV